MNTNALTVGANIQVQKENAKYIEITRKTVRFGRSVYQFKNVTGFSVGAIPKDKFPWMVFLILVVAGLAMLPLAGLGLVLLVLAGVMVYSYFYLPQEYGLRIFLNSGGERFFVSTDEIFLNKVVSILYSFMEEETEQEVIIDLSNRSINVSGDFHGTAITGDENSTY